MSDSEPPPVPTNDFDALAASPAVAEARFACVRHGVEAGAVSLHGNGAMGWMVVVDSLIGNHYERIDAPAAEGLHDALARADAAAIHRLDQEWAPFYCPVCAVSYCLECWRTSLVFDPEWPSWLEEMRGVCPEGHDRMLSD